MGQESRVVRQGLGTKGKPLVIRGRRAEVLRKSETYDKFGCASCKEISEVLFRMPFGRPEDVFQFTGGHEWALARAEFRGY